jgi:hypothetical protein
MPLSGRPEAGSGSAVPASRSRDAGATWRALAAPTGLLAWPRSDRLYALDDDGVASVSGSAGRTWQAVGNVDGAPSAFDPGPGGRLLTALHDGTIMQSRNGGVTWTVDRGLDLAPAAGQALRGGAREDAQRPVAAS